MDRIPKACYNFQVNAYVLHPFQTREGGFMLVTQYESRMRLHLDDIIADRSAYALAYLRGKHGLTLDDLNDLLFAGDQFLAFQFCVMSGRLQPDPLIQHINWVLRDCRPEPLDLYAWWIAPHVILGTDGNWTGNTVFNHVLLPQSPLQYLSCTDKDKMTERLLTAAHTTFQWDTLYGSLRVDRLPVTVWKGPYRPLIA